ncbi:hypothetical protein [Saccharothrix hoggarensis]|uniref:Uncharacterized protein n=1 Tax=Saccharothrix hoggarensis TaxID=913853 RepID=A0ABW3QQ54_9PSEU
MAAVPWGTIALYAGVALAPSALCWVVLNVPRYLRRLDPRHRAPAASGPPIEQVAADLRRVHRLLAHVPPGTPQARRAGARQAYDALLVQACAALDVEHRFDTLLEGVDREVERLRVEESLRSAGLRIP